jgi:hypothetical protein
LSTIPYPEDDPVILPIASTRGTKRDATTPVNTNASSVWGQGAGPSQPSGPPIPELTTAGIDEEDAELQEPEDEVEDDPESDTAYLQWAPSYQSKQPPPTYHDWTLHPGLHEAHAHQSHYLAQCTPYTGEQYTRTCVNDDDDLPEVEIGPRMAAFFVGVPELAADEILVFKTNKAGAKTSAQIEKNYDFLTPEEVVKHSKEVEAAIRKEVRSFFDLKTFERYLVKEFLFLKKKLKF